MNSPGVKIVIGYPAAQRLLYLGPLPDQAVPRHILLRLCRRRVRGVE
jgi:hypothetical protein